MLISQKNIPLIRKEVEEKGCAYCSGIILSARWFLVNQYGHSRNMIVLPDKESAEYCCYDLYNIHGEDDVYFFPDSGKKIERSNYKNTLNVQRTSALGKLEENDFIIVTYPSALEEAVSSDKKNLRPFLSIRKDDEISHENILSEMISNGFVKVDFVSEPGQFAIRGGIIDIFSYSYNYPYRISFFGDSVENIYVFDADTQLSKNKLDSIDIFSCAGCDEESESKIYLYDILPDDTLVWFDSSDIYKDSSFYEKYLKYRRIYLDIPVMMREKSSETEFNITPQPPFNKNFDILVRNIDENIERGYKVNIIGEKRSQLDRLKSIIVQSGGRIPEFISGKNIHNGFIDNESKICFYTDHEIFNRFHRVTLRNTVEKSEQLTINDLTSFSIGDYIVHVDYGVGIFGGLVRMKDEKGRMHEVIKLQYKDNDIVFISVHSLHKISRFKSKDSLPPSIHKLGSKTWQNLKANTKSKVKDIARDLINLYAKRKATRGFAFSPDSYLQEELESSFIYEDTPDQEKASIAVKRDMEDICPMDRLVCGDVGFGKTEIAIRAAFKAVSDSKQVAVLVPTTILCLQHYNTFISRLENFPCNIDYVSRLRTAKEISEIKEKLKKGSIDILIGTHKILGKGFDFKDLGLLIIDEEQKFGVSAKEKLRELKANVDTLTLTATPIPRTLQFSLLGARDLSIINTPPPNRIPVQTEIIHFDRNEIKSVINYELNRGGQIFFVHNRVEEIESIYNILHSLVPDMSICIAHGQMESKVLEDKILDFMEGNYDMLLCTTIIENGLDIPNANTIIINQAQNIGLSDLHQLRGRVGRSNRRAFCYLIVPPLAGITEDARRRLKAIESFSDLGSGFNIAMQDLDIRGAGNLLGAEQSGFITDMGFETYQKILSEAMEELGIESYEFNENIKETVVDKVTDCTIETDQLALIPDSYLDITSEKIRIYKELDSLDDEESLTRMRSRLEDRFGKIPQETERLFDIVRIRQMAQRYGIEKVIIKNGIMIIFFISNPLSPFFKSSRFNTLLNNVNEYGNMFEMKQTDGRLKIICRKVEDISKARSIISLLTMK